MRIFKFYFFIFLFCTGCPIHKIDTRLNFLNRSNKNLFIYNEFSNINDTIIHCENCYSNFNDWVSVAPNDTSYIVIDKILYDEYLKQNPTKILRIFVIESDTLTKYGWGKVKNKYMVLKRFDYSLDSIQQHKEMIIYP